MEEQKKKFNPHSIIIIILILIILGFAYNQWGKSFLPRSSESGKEISFSDIKTQIFKDDIQIGNANAPITIIEYYSYVCSFCKQFEDETKPRIVENYIVSGKVKLILRPFPPYEFGQAVLCANEQEKFLEYHNYLFENAENLQKAEDLKTFAKNVGLDENKFAECYDSEKYKKRAEDWYNQGVSDMTKAKIPQDKIGTPIFFVNGEPILGAQPYANFVEIIEEKLK